MANDSTTSGQILMLQGYFCFNSLVCFAFSLYFSVKNIRFKMKPQLSRRVCEFNSMCYLRTCLCLVALKWQLARPIVTIPMRGGEIQIGYREKNGFCYSQQVFCC